MNKNEFVDDDVIQVSDGKYICITDPDMDDITIYDIAHALSNCGRYAGHCKFLYVVAQHSVLGSYEANSTGAAWDFLMHDATEAYLVDIPSPIKYTPQMKGYKELENIWEPRMCDKFKVLYPLSPEVKKLDIEALATERRDLLHPNGKWGCLEGVKPWDAKIHCWHPLYAEYRFLKRVREVSPFREHKDLKVPNPIIPMMMQGMQRFAMWCLS